MRASDQRKLLRHRWRTTWTFPSPVEICEHPRFAKVFAALQDREHSSGCLIGTDLEIVKVVSFLVTVVMIQ